MEEKELFNGSDEAKQETQTDERTQEMIQTESEKSEELNALESPSDKRAKKSKDKKEKKEKKEKQPMEPARKKKIIKRSIFGGVAAIFLSFIVVSNIMAAGAKMPVMTISVAKGDIEQTLSTSGSVTANKSQVYFAQTAVKIGTIDVKAGETVEKGKPIITYDAQSLENERKSAELSLQANKGGYDNNVQKNNESWADLGEANVNLDVLETQITDIDNYIKALQTQVNDKKAALAHEGALLQISLIDWADQPDSDEYENLQKLVQINQYEQTNNEQIRQWQDEITKYTEMLQNCKEYKSEMKSQKNAADGTKLTSGGKEELEAKTELDQMTSEEKLKIVDAVSGGILAEFNGVVTEMSVVEGSTPAVGTQMFKLESTDDVKVSIKVTKYDLEKIAVGQKASITVSSRAYEGEVIKIDKMATPNSSGAPVVNADVKFTNPDDGIFLGVEAKVSINTASATQALLVPVTAVNTDKEGDFVYAVADGIVVRKPVKTGISSDIQIEILEGVSEGDQIIGEVSANIIEGMEVNAIPQA